METPETYSLVSTHDEPSRNKLGCRNTTALLSTQGSQLTPPNEPEQPAYEITSVNETKPETTQRTPSLWSLWWVEILNCLLMFGMLCAIVGVLYPNNGKPLPDLPYKVFTLFSSSMIHTSPGQGTQTSHISYRCLSIRSSPSSVHH